MKAQYGRCEVGWFQIFIIVMLRKIEYESIYFKMPSKYIYYTVYCKSNSSYYNCIQVNLTSLALLKKSNLKKSLLQQPENICTTNSLGLFALSSSHHNTNIWLIKIYFLLVVCVIKSQYIWMYNVLKICMHYLTYTLGPLYTCST